jgi:hypothetical protein
MPNINIIFTIHREHGKCNSNELYSIFEHIRPEVIFEEVPPLRADAYYKEESIYSLETDTIKKYKQRYTIKDFPVDKNYDMKEVIEQFKRYSYLNNVFFDHSYEYNDLWANNVKITEKVGFKYFNSKQYSTFSENFQKLSEGIIFSINNISLTNMYNNWNKILNERDITMINNIIDYCKNTKFDNAIFTIGAEHKTSIIKILNNLEKDLLNINWIYDKIL